MPAASQRIILYRRAGPMVDYPDGAWGTRAIVGPVGLGHKPFHGFSGRRFLAEVQS